MIPDPHSPLDPDLYPAGTQLEAAGSAVAWTAILAGTATAIATWLTLLMLGAGFCLTQTVSWSDMQPAPTAFRVAVGVWLIVTQWLSFALGGYVAGRLRVRWASLHNDEVFFRDTAHGLLVWAVATVLVVGAAALLAAGVSHKVVPADARAIDPDLLQPDLLQKAAAASAIFTAIAMITGAFVASVAAVIGGRLRDRHP